MEGAAALHQSRADCNKGQSSWNRGAPSAASTAMCAARVRLCLQSWRVLLILNDLQIITVFTPSFAETSKNQFAVSYFFQIWFSFHSPWCQAVCVHLNTDACKRPCACVCVCVHAQNSKAGSAARAWSHGKYAAGLHRFSKQWETQKASEA